ncbi:MAG: cytochrome c [Pseudomonadota bacterium]|nr:cytochrome c [Pseudomonadota bacterium]
MKGIFAMLAILAAASAYPDSPLFTPRAAIGALNGEQIYDHICQGCHMTGGAGAIAAGTYPKLAANKKLVSWEFVALTVLNGRNGMPPFGHLANDEQSRATHLTDAQIADVVNYLRSHFDNNYKTNVTAKQVAGLPHPTAELIGPQ